MLQNALCITFYIPHCCTVILLGGLCWTRHRWGLGLMCNSSVLSMLIRNVVQPLHKSIDHLVWEME